MPEPQKYPALLGVTCDGYDGDGTNDDDECYEGLEADFLVSDADTRDTRLGYALDHAARNGWKVAGRDRPQMALTYCPRHHHLAP